MAIPTCSDIALLALDLGKATFDNTYDSIATLQARVEDGARTLAREASWVPSELQGVVEELIGLARRTRGDLKGTVDRCYVLLRELAAQEHHPPRVAPAPRRRATSSNLRAA
jgi:hypothetical protein